MISLPPPWFPGKIVSMLKLHIAWLGAVLAAAPLPAAPYLVKNLNRGPADPGGATLNGAVAAGEILYFSASDPAHGLELWRSDGTAAGTARVATLCTAPLEGSDCQAFQGLQSIGSRVLFELFEPTASELWVSDGTTAGTFPLKQLVSGLPDPTTAPVPAGSFAFFWTTDGLWRTDGTAAGTARVKAIADLVPDRPGIDRTVYYLAVSAGVLYTVLGTGDLVRSDGSPEGTTILHTFQAGYAVHELTPLAGSLLFEVDGTTDDPDTSLWRTGGTAATTTTEKIATLPRFGTIEVIVPLGDRAVFRVVYRTASSESSEIWVTDGTASGTALVTAPGPSDHNPFAVTAGRAFFGQPGADPRSNILWTTDATSAGTFPLRDFGAGPGSGAPLEQTAFGGRLLFSARTTPLAAPLFLSDGTAAGTVPLSQEALFATGFTQVGGEVFFAAGGLDLQIPGIPPSQNALWKTDGTPAGTVRLADTLGFAFPKRLGRSLLFTAAAPSHFGTTDLELFRNDGAFGGNTLVQQINPYPVDSFDHNHNCISAPSSPGPGVLLGNRVLFAADDGVHGRELWEIPLAEALAP
jgi:ELWxxDGT repeat protein